eukprot:TRINITY_DN2697_c0_g2_i1.p1 TRINITY_DN2697_c0_g2~~TRINITY_DN2697_c0_g2_i1.p1  ORF type:complete len:167 (+),score=19.49 TRINITY_DN2697_c0_g2_i1:212-712(+)
MASAATSQILTVVPSVNRHLKSAPSSARLLSSRRPAPVPGLGAPSLQLSADVKSNPLAAASNGGNVSMAAGGAYICRDCGYIYNDRRKSFDSLTSDYSCPVCQAPKRRFKAYAAPVERNANDLAVRKARKESLKAADGAVGSALPILIAAFVAILVGATIYLNNQY